MAAASRAAADTAPEVLAEWERRAGRIVDGLVQAIRGRCIAVGTTRI